LPDYDGALCLGSARCIEFVEMFKAPLKVLNPILTATQEGNFKGTEALPALPRRLVRDLSSSAGRRGGAASDWSRRSPGGRGGSGHC